MRFERLDYPIPVARALRSRTNMGVSTMFVMHISPQIYVIYIFSNGIIYAPPFRDKWTL